MNLDLNSLNAIIVSHPSHVKYIITERPHSRQGNGEDLSSDPNGHRYPDKGLSSRQGYPDDYSRSRHGYPDDRPRSRQGYPDDRPRSRQGYPDDRPHSRQSVDDRGYYDTPNPRNDSSQQYDRQGVPEYDRSYTQGTDSRYSDNRYRNDPYYYPQGTRQNYPDDRPRSRQGSPDNMGRKEREKRERLPQYGYQHGEYDSHYGQEYYHQQAYGGYMGQGSGYYQGYDPYSGYNGQQAYYGYRDPNYDYYYQQQRGYTQNPATLQQKTSAGERGFNAEMQQYHEQYGHGQQPQPAFNYGSVFENHRPPSVGGYNSSRGTTPLDSAADQFALEGSTSRPSSRQSHISAYSQQGQHLDQAGYPIQEPHAFYKYGQHDSQWGTQTMQSEGE